MNQETKEEFLSIYDAFVCEQMSAKDALEMAWELGAELRGLHGDMYEEEMEEEYPDGLSVLTCELLDLADMYSTSERAAKEIGKKRCAAIVNHLAMLARED